MIFIIKEVEFKEKKKDCLNQAFIGTKVEPSKAKKEVPIKSKVNSKTLV
jgi:hypothetical protein